MRSRARRILRYREALGETIGAIPEGLYPGDYLKPVGAALAQEYGDRLKGKPEANGCAPVRAKAVAMMMDMIRDDLAALNVRHDVFFSERSLVEGGDKVGATIEALRQGREGLRRTAAAAERSAGAKTTRTASKRCSAPPSSATTSTGR